MQFSKRYLLLAFTAVIALQFGLSPVAKADLIGWWPFDEITEVDGQRVTPDASPDGGHDGIVSETAELADDPDRGSVMNFGEFNNNAVVELPSFPQNEEAPAGVFEDRGDGFNAIVESQEVTISFWLNRGAEPATNQWTFLFNAPSGRQLGSHAPWSNGQVYFDVSGCCGPNQRINTSMGGADVDGEWHHLAYVKKANRDESDLAVSAIFQDGVPLVSSPGCDLACWADGAEDVDWGAATIDDVVPITTAAIGASSGGGSSQNGFIDDFAIWDEALPTGRIVALSQGGGIIPRPPGTDEGDFNDDGVVDELDFLIIAENLNEQFTLDEAFFKGDMDGNLRVNMKDFLAFRGFVESQGAAAASVPEPSASLLLILASLPLLAARRRRA